MNDRFQYYIKNSYPVPNEGPYEAGIRKELLQKEQFRTAVILHGLRVLPILRRMGKGEVRMILDDALPLMLAEDLSVQNHPHFDLPSWASRKISGGELGAVVIFGCWVWAGERPDLCYTLCQDWPEIEGVCRLLEVLS